MRRVSMATRDELVAAVIERYRASRRAEKAADPGRVRRGDGVSIASTRCACSAPGHRQHALGATAVAAHLRRGRARGADRAVGGVGSGLWQATEGDRPDADRGDGAPWASGTRARGARGAAEDECGDDRPSPAAATRALQHAAPTTEAPSSAIRRINSGADLLGLARSAARLRRGGPRRALRSGDERRIRADARRHGYRVRLDRTARRFWCASRRC